MWTRRFKGKLLATDLLVISVAVAAAVVLDAVSGVGNSAALGQHAVVAGAVAAEWLIVLELFHTRSTPLLGIGAGEYRRVLNASLLFFGGLAIAFIALHVEGSTLFFVVTLPSGTVGLLAGRWGWRRWLYRQREYGNYLSRAIVVGERADVAYVAQQIARTSGAAFAVVGAALYDGTSHAVRFLNESVPVVAAPDDVAEAAGRLGADTVIVAGERRGENTYVRDLGWSLESTGTELVVASKLTNVAGPRIHFRPVDGLPLMHVELPHYEGARHVLKRLFDILVSASSLVIASPIMLALALAVRLDSDGPALFKQERVGKDGEMFSMLKFRSMVQAAEDDLAGLLDKNEGAGVLFKMRNDPRVTRVGRFLRAYSLDELPQLINILKGDMSLVGPRPPLPREVDEYEQHVHRRLYIKPGLTGMWQVSGRSDLDWEESVRLDLYYVENWSLLGDLMIIWRTFRVLLNPVGAY